MAKREKSSAELHALREECLRPSRWLGYEHNTLAVHLFKRGAFDIAEAELRRAIWLNPYEPAFVANLAWCLFELGRVPEAKSCANEVRARDPENAQVRELVARLDEYEMGRTNPHTDTDGDEARR